MIYVTGDTHGPVKLGPRSVDGYADRFNTANFPEQKQMTRDDYVIVCGDFGGIWDYDSRYDPSMSSFRERKFLLEDGFLMEARPQEYMAIKSEKRRQRYQKELASKNDVSLDNLPEETLATLSIDPEQDVSKVVEKKIMNEALSKALLRLPEKDQLLIYQYHFAGISMSELAKMYGVSRQIISRRIKRVYLKLKVMIE